MLLVKTKVAPSSVHGLGLFAAEDIPAATIIWKFTAGFDQKFTRAQILSFPPMLQIYIYTYAWKSKKSGLYCFSSDSGKYFNHRDTPNCLSQYVSGEEEVVTKTLKDIPTGEELLDDYSSFENDWSDDDVLREIAEIYDLTDELDPRFKMRS